MSIMKSLVGCVLATAVIVNSHLVDGSLLPKGGETIFVGDVVSINWKTSTNHLPQTGVGGINIDFSKDAGASWTTIKTDFNDNEKTNTFRWTVPANLTTTSGLFRICQSGPCTDAMKTTRASANGSPWYLVSGAVKIQASTALADAPGAAQNLAMDFNPDTRNVEVSFGLARPQDVQLQAFDTQGRLVATLLQGTYATGSHSLSVFSNRLVQGAGSLVFKLKVGEQVKTHTWLSVR